MSTTFDDADYTFHRAFVIGPVVCTLIGCSAGICLGMLYRQDPLERAHVDLENSLPLAVGGGLCGLLTGLIPFGVCIRWPRLLLSMTLLIMAVSGAGMAAPLGWIIGDLGQQRMPRMGMTIGVAIGATIGLALGALQFRSDRRKHDAKI